ncbi:MAG: SPFH domain-containing protein [Planctomycetia bacterium]
MGIFLSVIESTDQQPGELAVRIPQDGSAETNFGSQCVVRDFQRAIFRKDGKATDMLEPGRHTLTTKNIPILTKVLSLPFGFTSPFRCEVVFVSMRTLPDLKWGTREPVPFRDKELGLVRLRAFGTYGLRVIDPMVFASTLVANEARYSAANAEEYLKSTIVQSLNDWLGTHLTSVFDLPSKYDEVSRELGQLLDNDVKRFGLSIENFRVNAITPPEAVQQAIDERSRMGALGDLGAYTRLKAAEALGDAARNPGGGGAAAAGVGLGAGLGMGQVMADALRQSQQPAAPAPGAAAGPSVADQLRQLAALHKEGLLTEAEFQAKRAELIKRL